MSIAKSIIGEPAPKAESKTVQTEAAAPIHPMELIDALAEQELREDGSASSTSVKHAFQKKKEKGAGGGYVAGGKTTTGQVAAKPGTVSYGKK